MISIDQLTTLLESDGYGCVARCPELDIASQGKTIEEARANLREALELFFEVASKAEIERRISSAKTAREPNC